MDINTVLIHGLQLIWLIFPGYCANMAAPFSRFLSRWNRPIAPHALGEHKTALGLVLGVCAAVVTTGLQAATHIAWNRLPESLWPITGAALGMGALGGDMLKSLLKRQFGLPPGARWIPFDQLDFIVGTILVLLIWVRLSFGDIVFLLAFSFVADIAVNQVSYRLKIRQTAW